MRLYFGRPWLPCVMRYALWFGEGAQSAAANTTGLGSYPGDFPIHVVAVGLAHSLLYYSNEATQDARPDDSRALGCH